MAKSNKQQKSPAHQSKRNMASTSPAIKRPKAIVEITLRTGSAEKTFNREFTKFSIYVLHITQILRRNNHYDLAKQAQDVVDGWLTDELTELTSKIESLEELKNQRAINVNMGHSEIKVKAEASSPFAIRYLDLIERMDDLIHLMDELWLGGVFDDDQLSKGSYYWEKRLRTIANKTRNLSNQAKNASKKQSSSEKTEKEIQPKNAAADAPENEILEGNAASALG